MNFFGRLRKAVHAAFLWHKALESATKDDWARALEYVRKFLVIAQRDLTEAKILEGNALSSLGRHEEAIMAYNRALEVMPREKGYTLDDIAYLKAFICIRDTDTFRHLVLPDEEFHRILDSATVHKHLKRKFPIRLES
jgi:tetratricopeptide (TPR) repeat protein